MEDNVKFVARETKEEVSKLRQIENFLIEKIRKRPRSQGAGRRWRERSERTQGTW